MGGVLSCWTRTLFKLEHALGVIFGAWGRIVARHPGLVIMISFAVAIGLALCMANLETDVNTISLYAAVGTRSYQYYKKWISTWAEYDPDTRFELMILAPSTKGDTETNMYTDERMNQLYSIHSDVLDISVTDADDNEYKFEDLCEQSYANNDNCLIECIFEFMEFDQSQISLYVANAQNDNTNVNLSYALQYPVSWSTYSEDYEALFTLAGTPQRHFSYNYTYGTGHEYVTTTVLFFCFIFLISTLFY